jgi:hypothetical protein
MSFWDMRKILRSLLAVKVALVRVNRECKQLKPYPL